MPHDLAVIGLGYIGLPMAALSAKAGLRVLGVDINPQVVETVGGGGVHIEEPGLPELVKAVVGKGALRADTKPAAADIFMIAVPTPVDHATHQPDMEMVKSAAIAIAGVAQPGSLVILQSTSPVGSTAWVKAVIEKEKPELKDRLEYAYCPERAIPGKTMQEMIHNDRAIGGLTPNATRRGIAFYRKLVKGALLETSAETAEMVKLVENASRDVEIAFANELSLACDALGLNVWEVIRLANRHPRVNILQPGPGVGGHCIAIDPWFIIDAAPGQTPLMRAARAVNDGKPYWVVEKILAACEPFSHPKICLLGLAYKENVDDFRESPAITIAESLLAANVGKVTVVDPFMPESNRYTLVPLMEGIKTADIIVLLTAHDQFKAITADMLKDKIVIDTRGKLPTPSLSYVASHPVCA